MPMDLRQARQLFCDLLRVRSVSPSPGEEQACALLARVLKQHGIPYRIVEKEPGRANLIACLKAGSPTGEAPIALISHIDVADVDEARWSAPPFAAEEHSGRILARGTLDTKHLTVMELYALLKLHEKCGRLRRDVYFIATADEECGSERGMGWLHEAEPALFSGKIVLNEGGGFPLRINGENFMLVTAGEKGVCRVRLSARGQASHASAPSENQAMVKLAHALRLVYENEARLAGGSRAVYERQSALLGSGPYDAPLAEDIHRYAASSSIGARGYRVGERVNTVPAEAEIVLECKVLPGVDEAAIRRFFSGVLEDDAVRWEILSFERGFECRDFERVSRDIEAQCRAHGLDCRALPMLALGRTDGRFFGMEGSDVYGFSPVTMDDSFDTVLPKVHGDNESISLDSFAFGCRVLAGLLEQYSL